MSLTYTQLTRPGKRKPKLQIKILESLAMKGKLARSITETLLIKHHRPEILQAFKILRAKELIKELNTDPGSGKVFSRGRPPTYYKITKQGLATLIIEEPDLKKFWRLLIGFCFHSDCQVSLSDLNDLYELFINKYLEYPSVPGAFFQLDAFNKMCSNWIQKNVRNNNEMSLSQKVIEVLSIYRGITLEELVTKTEESQEEVKKVLNSYTMTYSNYTDIYYISDEDYLDHLPEQYMDFLNHSIIATRHNTEDTIAYELSLFGVMLVMTIVRSHDRDEMELFNNNFSFEGYFDKLVSNYHDKLPLIFGKWFTILKKHLKVWSAYNFDIVLIEENARSEAMDIPVAMKGNKEYYQNMHSLALYNNRRINDVFEMGRTVYNDYQNDKADYLLLNYDNENSHRVVTLYQKLQEIELMLKYSNPQVFQEELYEEQRKEHTINTLEKIEQIDIKNNISPIEVLEKSLAKEITFLYYLNLDNDQYIPLLLPNSGYHLMLSESIRSKKSSQKNKIDSYNSKLIPRDYILPKSPKERLLEIMKEDEEIRKWVFGWMKDLVNYQKEVSKIMHEHLYNESK
jgi:hypothetical protein